MNRWATLIKGRLERHVPALNVSRAMSDLGFDVDIVCSDACPETIELLRSHGISVHRIAVGHAEPRTKVGKLQHWRNYRRGAMNWLKGQRQQPHLWVLSADTALVLKQVLRSRQFVLQICELYDTVPHYLRWLRPLAQQATAVVVPEACRAAAFRTWYNLPRTPFVLPNKPYDQLQGSQLPIRDECARDTVAALAGRKIVLYQGHIGGRRDLRPIAEGIKQLGLPFHLLLLGTDHSHCVSELKRIYPATSHIPFVKPPGHLEITSHAHIGLVSYAFDCLNSVFCAPNKIWEYAGFGVPMLCRNLPGLEFTVGTAGAGICTPFESPQEIAQALAQLDRGRADYSQRAREFFTSIDCGKIVADIASSLTPVPQRCVDGSTRTGAAA